MQNVQYFDTPKERRKAPRHPEQRLRNRLLLPWHYSVWKAKTALQDALMRFMPKHRHTSGTPLYEGECVFDGWVVDTTRDWGKAGEYALVTCLFKGMRIEQLPKNIYKDGMLADIHYRHYQVMFPGGAKKHLRMNHPIVLGICRRRVSPRS